MKSIFLLFSLMLFSINSLFSQGRYVLSGNIKNSDTKEVLVGVNIYLPETGNGTSSDKNGNYRLYVDSGTLEIKFSYVGYETCIKKLNVRNNQKLNVNLSPVNYEGKTFVISGRRSEDNIAESQMGKIKLNVESIKKMPAFFGEVDILKNLQLLPGIQSSGEGNSGFYVRGGSVDQNLILLDHASIYNVGHLFGFFSVFNSDAVQSAEIMKGDMPANYGGRLSSVLNVSVPDGNNKNYSANIGIGLIFSNIHAEGPIKRNKSSFLFSARRTYVDAVIQPFLSEGSNMKGIKFYFYDLNGKLTCLLDRQNKISFNIYHGSDVYGFKSKGNTLNSLFKWSNSAASLQWWHFFNTKLNFSTSLSLSNYNFGTDMNAEIYNISINSGINDYSAHSELNWKTGKNNNVYLGLDYIFHTFMPNHYEAVSGKQTMNLQNREALYAQDAAIYALERFYLWKKIKINAGLRCSYFQQTGPHDTYILNEVGQVIDTLFIPKGKKIKDYMGLEPRISARFLIDSTKSIKATYNHTCQYVQQVTLSCISLPTDAWIPSTADISPQNCNQFAIGWFQDFMNHDINTSFEAYYKIMHNLTEYREGFSPFTEASHGYANPYTQGDGWSYGFEFFIQKNQGKLNGWIGYTLSWSYRQFEEINNGKTFCAKNDRRHDISLMLSYNILPQLSTSLVWVYATGNTMTVPVGYYFMGYNMIIEYSKTNAYRMPPYHRMDISVNWTFRRSEHCEQSLNFSVYNVYNRRNPFFINIYTNMEGNSMSNVSLKSTAYQMSLFPILPSITWNVKFK